MKSEKLIAQKHDTFQSGLALTIAININAAAIIKPASEDSSEYAMTESLSIDVPLNSNEVKYVPVGMTCQYSWFNITSPGNDINSDGKGTSKAAKTYRKNARSFWGF